MARPIIVSAPGALIKLFLTPAALQLAATNAEHI